MRKFSFLGIFNLRGLALFPSRILELILFNLFTLLGYFSFTLQPLYEHNITLSTRLKVILFIPPLLWVIGLLSKNITLLITLVPLSWFSIYQLFQSKIHLPPSLGQNYWLVSVFLIYLVMTLRLGNLFNTVPVHSFSTFKLHPLSPHSLTNGVLEKKRFVIKFCFMMYWTLSIPFLIDLVHIETFFNLKHSFPHYHLPFYGLMMIALITIILSPPFKSSSSFKQTHPFFFLYTVFCLMMCGGSVLYCVLK